MMRHTIDANGRAATVTVKDYDTIAPLIGITIDTHSASAQISLTAQQADDLITLLQFYRARLDFTPPGE